MSVQDRIKEFTKLSQREFSKKVDDYIRHDITDEEVAALESPELLIRMYFDLISTEKGIRGQYAIAQSDYDLEVIEADGDKGLEDRALAKYRKALKPKQRFSLGLNDTIAHVSWLMWNAYPRELALSMDRDQLASELDAARKALFAHRENGLADPEGYLDREADLWVSCASLIGPTQLDD